MTKLRTLLAAWLLRWADKLDPPKATTQGGGGPGEPRPQ